MGRVIDYGNGVPVEHNAQATAVEFNAQFKAQATDLVSQLRDIVQRIFNQQVYLSPGVDIFPRIYFKIDVPRRHLRFLSDKRESVLEAIITPRNKEFGIRMHHPALVKPVGDLVQKIKEPFDGIILIWPHEMTMRDAPVGYALPAPY